MSVSVGLLLPYSTSVLAPVFFTQQTTAFGANYPSKDKSIVETQLTKDGVQHYSYASSGRGEPTIRKRRIKISGSEPG